MLALRKERLCHNYFLKEKKKSNFVYITKLILKVMLTLNSCKVRRGHSRWTCNGCYHMFYINVSW